MLGFAINFLIAICHNFDYYLKMEEKVILKRYTNRRLYDTEKSAYVTLSQVAEMIKQGRQVEVIDAESKEDVTTFIFTQIIMEEARKKTSLLPVSLLYLIIRYGGTVIGEFCEKYLEQIFRNYLTYKTMMDEQFRKWLDMGVNLSNITERTMERFSPLNPFADSFSTAASQKEKEEQEG